MREYLGRSYDSGETWDTTTEFYYDPTTQSLIALETTKRDDFWKPDPDISTSETTSGTMTKDEAIERVRATS